MFIVRTVYASLSSFILIPLILLNFSCNRRRTHRSTPINVTAIIIFLLYLTMRTLKRCSILMLFLCIFVQEYMYYVQLMRIMRLFHETKCLHKYEIDKERAEKVKAEDTIQ
jgi:Ca2+/Na+ antiporter